MQIIIRARIHQFIMPFVIAMCVAHQTDASVIDHLSSRDSLEFGADMITFDSTTGLEWLDLTVTLGDSLLETETRVNVCQGACEWRWATNSEVFDLISHIDVVHGYKSGDIERGAAARLFTTLLGGFFDETHMSYRTRGFSAYSSADNEYGGEYSTLLVHGGGSTSYIGGWYGGLRLSDSDGHFEVGSWLVRSVPTPSTLLLFSIGLLGLGYKKTSKGIRPKTA